jgi:hypothetical protein
MLDPTTDGFIEEVESQAIFGNVDDFQEFLAEDDPVSRLHDALEDRFLNALAVILAGLGHPTQATATLTRRGRYIIGDHNQHAPSSTRGYLKTQGR